jgi:predicted phage terminase large subunit-like protein
MVEVTILAGSSRPFESEPGSIPLLKSETRLPILPVKPQGDKVSRAHAVSPLVESGRVCVPESAAWLNDFTRRAA